LTNLVELSDGPAREANPACDIAARLPTCSFCNQRETRHGKHQAARQRELAGQRQGRQGQPYHSERDPEGHAVFLQRALRHGKGTNPEELIAAAHAGCFSMATAFQLSGAGHPPDSLHTEATLTMEQEGGGWKIAAVHLVLRARVPGLDDAKFQELAAGAKANCPVSKVLNADITLDAKLE
jgi:OsmC subfamily peroxiredoxin